MHRHAARRRMRLADSAELCRDATSTWIAFRRHSGKVVKCAAMLAIVPTCAGAAGVLDPQGPVGSAEKLILINSLAIMLPIVIPTILATLGFAWWFRASNAKAAYQPSFVYSGRIELIGSGCSSTPTRKLPRSISSSFLWRRPSISRSPRHR